MSGTDFYYDPCLRCRAAQRLAPMPGPHKIYYGNSGAEAIEAALKLARYPTGVSTSSPSGSFPWTNHGRAFPHCVQA